MTAQSKRSEGAEPPRAPLAGAAWPLVGRDGELDVLRRSMDDHTGVVITGELGVGKSRLAASLTDALVADGWTHSAHVASEARQGIPFAAFAALLDDVGDAGNRLQQLVAGAAKLGTGDAPLVLHVEDGHWLDDESLAFVQQVAESATATLLLTVRSGDPGSARMIGMARAMGLRRMEVQPLARAEVADLLHHLVPGIARTEVHRLWELTGGNPLYLHELVTRALEQGVPVLGDDGLVLATVDHTGLAELVGDRLDDLDAGQQEVLEVLAVAPGAPLDLLYSRAGTEGVVDLQRRQLVAVVESGRRLVATLGHPMYGEVVTARMGAATRRIRRRQVLAEVEAHGSRRGSDLIQSALWANEQGDAVDPQALLAVARRMSGLVPQAATASHGVAPTIRRGLEASAARLAKAAVLAGGGFEAALTWFKAEAHCDGASRATAEALAAMYEKAETDEQRTRVAVEAAGIDLLLGRLAPSEGMADLEALRSAAGSTAGSTELSRTLDSWRVIFLTMNGEHLRAVELAREVLADPMTATADRLRIGGALVGCQITIGRPADAVATSDLLLGEIGVDDDQWDVGTLLLSRVLALSTMGRGDEAVGLAAQLTALCEATGNDAGLAGFAVAGAQDLLFRGRPQDALAGATAAIGALRDAEATAHIGTYGPAHAVVAHCHAVLGHRQEATDALARMAEAPQQDLVFPMVAVLASAAVAALEGRHRSAIATLRAGVERRQGGVAGSLLMLHEMMRLGERGCGGEMQAILDPDAGSPLWEAWTAHAVAFDADDGSALDAASSDLAALGYVLPAAEAAAQAANCHAGAGHRTDAVASRERSRALAAECQGAVTPALEVKSGAVRDLTKRELEVARLAARGATNREIADELVINVRTAETYLYRIYSKLGVESRADLAAHPEL